MIDLARALRFSGASTIAAVGAGGKTTALFQLARQLPGPVLVTTTTHLGLDQVRLADTHRVAVDIDDLADLEANQSGVSLISGVQEGGRVTGIPLPVATWLHAFCQAHALPLLIECDGARLHPLKAPAAHEPVIPDFVDLVLVVTGMSALGKPLDETTIHRSEIFSLLSGCKVGEIITQQAIASVLAHARGGLKEIPARARRVALLNQADTLEQVAQAQEIARELHQAYDAIIIASLKQPVIHGVHEPVGAVVLAAGASSRLGQPKQLLDYHGKPFVRQITETALAAGLSPVVVVTGAHAEAVSDAVAGLPVSLCHNPAWSQGQSTSIRAGLQALPPSIGAAFFLLSDQPQVSVPVLQALRKRHRLDLSPVIAPCIRGRRANPVLFDRSTFPDLMKLKGDIGGRAIFETYPPVCLPWQDETLLMDVDTPQDYQELVGHA
jgi:molybdenum cofactor cytidylyltransferase